MVKFFGVGGDAGNNAGAEGEGTLSLINELPLELARKCVGVYGASFFQEGCEKHLLDFGCDDEAMALHSGKEFALMLSNTGKLYYTGKVI